MPGPSGDGSTQSLTLRGAMTDAQLLAMLETQDALTPPMALNKAEKQERQQYIRQVQQFVEDAEAVHSRELTGLIEGGGEKRKSAPDLAGTYRRGSIAGLSSQRASISRSRGSATPRTRVYDLLEEAMADHDWTKATILISVMRRSPVFVPSMKLFLLHLQECVTPLPGDRHTSAKHFGPADLAVEILLWATVSGIGNQIHMYEKGLQACLVHAARRACVLRLYFAVLRAGIQPSEGLYDRIIQVCDLSSRHDGHSPSAFVEPV